MSTCLFYEEMNKLLTSNEINLTRQAPIAKMTVKWCTHKHAPTDKHAATRTIGGGKQLNCQGCKEKCEIEDEKFNDMYP
jgi:hypothetical protein